MTAITIGASRRYLFSPYTNQVKETTMPATTAKPAITMEEATNRQEQFSIADVARSVALERRNAAVLALVRQGHRQNEIAAALGLNRSRIGQIIGAAERAEA